MTLLDESIEKLQTTVQRLHNCGAVFDSEAQVNLKFKGETAWEGIVHVFTLDGHPSAETCYAWSSAVEGSNKRRFYAVLKIPPVDTPQAAVRAAIIADHKAGRTP